MIPSLQMMKLRLRDLKNCLRSQRSLTEAEDNYRTVKKEAGLDKWKPVMQNHKNSGSTLDLT